jgi:hypothetical protein
MAYADFLSHFTSAKAWHRAHSTFGHFGIFFAHRRPFLPGPNHSAAVRDEFRAINRLFAPFPLAVWAASHCPVRKFARVGGTPGINDGEGLGILLATTEEEWTHLEWMYGPPD